MDYREHAKDLLKRKNSLVSAYSAIKEELYALENERSVCKAAIARAEAEGRDSSVYEDRLINLLADLEDCRFRKSVVERELKKLEKGLESLNEYQRELLEAFFSAPMRYTAEEIMQKWFKERSTVYRDKAIALEQFTRSVYGLVQL